MKGGESLKALIIAAGRGKRLGNKTLPKPLTLIFGVSLIERIIYRAKMAGIKDFVIVVGYKKDKIIKKLQDGKKYGVKIQYVVNDDWEKENGLSVLKAKRVLKDEESFLLLMSDHLFDHSIIKSLIKRKPKHGECILCVDRNIHKRGFDLEEATKVLVDNGRILSIGKNLKKFNAVDTGIFLCTPSIFDVLEESIKKEDYRLSEALRILAKRGMFYAVDVTGSFWVDIDNQTEIEKAEKILVENLSKQTDGPVSKFLNRPISKRLSVILAKTSITPDQITIISFLLAIASSIFFFASGYLKTVIGGILAQVSSIIDGCDGEVARLKLRFSKRGEWLDKILDRVGDGFIIIGITWASWMTLHREFVWIVGFLALMGSFLNSYTAVWYDNIVEREGEMRFGRDVRMFIIFLGALLGMPFLILLLLAIITNIENIRRLIRLFYGYEIVKEDSYETK